MSEKVTEKIDRMDQPDHWDDSYKGPLLHIIHKYDKPSPETPADWMTRKIREIEAVDDTLQEAGTEGEWLYSPHMRHIRGRFIEAGMDPPREWNQKHDKVPIPRLHLTRTDGTVIKENLAYWPQPFTDAEEALSYIREKRESHFRKKHYKAPLKESDSLLAEHWQELSPEELDEALEAKFQNDYGYAVNGDIASSDSEEMYANHVLIGEQAINDYLEFFGEQALRNINHAKGDKNRAHMAEAATSGKQNLNPLLGRYPWMVAPQFVRLWEDLYEMGFPVKLKNPLLAEAAEAYRANKEIEKLEEQFEPQTESAPSR